MRAWAIVKKEFKEYLLTPGTVSWGIIFPLVFTLSFIVRFGEIDTIAPGLIAISSLFSTTSFVAASIVMERKLKTFERLILAPISYGEIILGKALVGTIFGVFVGTITFSLVLGFIHGIAHPFLFPVLLLIGSFTFSLFGIFIGLIVKNPRNVMATLNLIRLPMMFTSGALSSLAVFPKWFLGISFAMPLTYAVEGLRYVLLNHYDTVPFECSVLLLIIFASLFTILSIKTLEKCY